MSEIYSNDLVRIEVEPSEIPWLKIFAQQSCKEFSDCNPETRQAVFELLDLIERQMLAYYSPEKINIASFGNYLPAVHWHIMARFKEDSFYPEPMWGTKQREPALALPALDEFLERLVRRIK